MSQKKWGDEDFWGLGYEYDPQWLLTDKQKELQAKIIDLARTTLRDNAVESDKKLIFPRKNFEAISKLGLLGLLVPKELGGMGENHTAAAMAVETIARYGCASTAMCYTMHLGAVAAALFRHHNNPTLRDILSRLDKDVLIGTLSYSDPETGSHFWYPVSSGAEKTAKGWHVRKKASWTTSGGFADWYIIQTTSPEFNGNYGDLTCWLIMGNEAKAEPSKWDGLGLRGNQSGTLEVDVDLTPDRMVGPKGDGAASNDECVDPFFLLCSSACWNGISLGMIDIAKRHTTMKKHVDVGMRVADYPTIQDYVGEAIIDTNTSRAMVFQMAKAMDVATNNCDWSIHKDLSVLPRAKTLHWMWQVKFSAAKNVAHVTDKMLHACGGTGYKPGLGIERYLRDGKAGWVMGPTNEVLRQFVGKSALLGFESLDYWNQAINERVLNNELKKLDAAGKRKLAEKLMAEAQGKAAE
ncbi:acyl-CoA dehydrogenase [Hypericibacter adhaerens]|jgi:alkylation response protein AidB-like acyl-CoA dehydrogenase|uniref:Acyl-CoA dehydrogenase n=1 Tax=Hypericibacter adhaerens TaxID=2602016 RepID=A0A5J6N0N9_9PROT|nr:acyl-CoA dehydrogenase family protein [Hypericibacter adhaerens]QEX22515.1 acyl-CoA dehydrogenase [Hypericibacter adhaerens]HVY52082.1 acyl-CoA dehydrogenase family protein [Devosia sp.]